MSIDQDYERIRAESRNDFEPKVHIFSPAIKANNKYTEIDYRDSFGLRAGAVYSAITGKQVTVQTLPEAKLLLINIAKSCLNLKNSKDSGGQSTKFELSVNSTEVALPDEQKEYADAIYLVLVFLPDLKKTVQDSKAVREAADKSYELTCGQEIIRDIVKYENQLPLSTIISVFLYVAEAIKVTKDAYLPGKKSLAESINSQKISENFYELLHPFCWYYSPFFSSSSSSSKLKNPSEDFKTDILKKRNLLECLHYSTIPSIATNEKVCEKVCHIPVAAKKLRRSGIRFQPSEEGSMRIKFQEPFLRIPALVCDFKLETVVRNLIAWERLNSEGQKPVMRYFQLMNELVKDVRDVRVLRKAGVLRGGAAKGRGVEELALLKRVERNACYPSVYFAVDMDVDKASKFYDERMKSFLVRNHPAVVWVSSVAAASVIATAIYASRRKGVHGHGIKN